MAEKLRNPSDGYFLAKREIQEVLEFRLNCLTTDLYQAIISNEEHRELELKSKIKQLEDVLNFVRNVMLWDTSKGE